jgi:hypothetical protein
MSHHLLPSTQPSIDLTPQPSQPPRTETSRPVLTLDRRLQFAQRLAVLIRRIHTQYQGGATEEPPDES